MSELTYILGAGASYQSIPVVKTFSKRFEKFVLEELSKSFKGWNGADWGDFIPKAKTLASEISSHQSFDTYFKKLFHNNLFEEINSSKRLLNMYFFWEHLTNGEDSTENKEDFKKESKIDKRYDALIAGLLKPYQKQLETFAPKVNFITWNYDLNLFSSLKNYFSPKSTFREFIEKIETSESIWEVENQIQVINMNGYFFSSCLEECINLKDEKPNLPANFNSKVFKDKIGNDSQRIKFAWEQNDNAITDKANTAISNSENIVVIGYTFPLYNRIVDLGYLNKRVVDSCRIVLQDPQADNLRTTFLEMFDLPGIDTPNSYLNVKKKIDCSYFYIPSNIFTEKNNFAQISFL